MDCIYFNHRGIEIASEDNLVGLLREISNKVELCRQNDIVIGFYKEIYSIELQNFNDNNFIDYICSKDVYRDFCNLIIKYIDTNKIYPQKNDKQNSYFYKQDYYNWFLKTCENDGIAEFISLSNDDIFQNESYGINNNILNFININNLSTYIHSKIEFNSFDEVFKKIESCYGDKIVIKKEAKTSVHQLNANKKMYYNVFKALEGLINIILPTNKNSLSKRIKDIFFENTSFKISEESNLTMQHPKYKRQRTFTINGEQYLFSNHVKIIDNRIHYYILDNKLYIGHCGNHLNTSSNN